MDHISTGGNAVASIHLFIRLFPFCLLKTDWPLTVIFCMCVSHYHGLQGIEAEGQWSRLAFCLLFACSNYLTLLLGSLLPVNVRIRGQGHFKGKPKERSCMRVIGMAKLALHFYSKNNNALTDTYCMRNGVGSSHQLTVAAKLYERNNRYICMCWWGRALHYLYMYCV